MLSTWRHALKSSRCIATRHQSTLSPHAVFSNSQSADFLAAAIDSASVPKLQGVPEVIVTGRANVGKSTLLNAVLGRKGLVHTSKKPGRTKSLNFYRVGPEPGQLVLVDAPGYGSRGRPEWGELFDEYVATRSVLTRIYILFNGKHGLNEVDRVMLGSLEEKCQEQEGPTRWTLQAIITKVDAMDGDVRAKVQAMQREIFETAPTCLPGILTASSKRTQLGIDAVRRNIIDACALGRISSTVRRG